MSKAQEAADRVETYLRERAAASGNDPELVAVFNGHELRIDDLVALIESAHWLALAGTGDIKREEKYAARRLVSEWEPHPKEKP